MTSGDKTEARAPKVESSKRPFKEELATLSYQSPRAKDTQLTDVERLSGRSIERLIAIGVVISFLLPIVVAGHGLAPIGMFLIFGEWGLPIYVGRAGIILIVLSIAFSSYLHPRWLSIAGIGLLMWSWALFMDGSERRAFTLITSLPFFAMLGWRLGLAVKSRGSKGNAPD